MTVRELVCREIAYRRVSFVLGLLSVTIAITAWVGSVALLRASAWRTDRILEQRERETREEMIRLEDDYRRIMRNLGYNVMILPGDQDLTALRARGAPDRTMPYDAVVRLAQGGIETLNHLLPVLQQRLVWPEHGLDIILSGTSGQVPIAHLRQFLTPDGTAYRNPIMPVIPDGELVIGASVARTLGVQVGDDVRLMGHPFRIRAIEPYEGTTDDMAVWCDLGWMQQQLDLTGRINVILALECVCHADSLGLITAEVQRLLPDVQVLEFSSRVKVRAQARDRAEVAHRTAIEAERRHREDLAFAQARFAAILAPLVVAGAAAWIFFLFLGNARDRSGEVAILRAIGVRDGAILAAFLWKGVLMGAGGAIVGYALGHGLAMAWAGIGTIPEMLALVDLRLFAVVCLAAPALCVLAAWGPAECAIRRDPAELLCQL